MELTQKQQQFVLEYLVDLNVTQAAIRAGYSKKTAAQQGHNLMRMPKIEAAIQEAQADRAARTQITGDRILRELARIAFADASDYAKVVCMGSAECVRLTPTEELSADQRAAIASIEETQTGIKVRTHDKVKALELLGKHQGIFTEKIAIATIDPERVKEVEALIHDMEGSG